MERFVMLVIITVTGALGGWIPTLFGASALGGWSILGSVIGGFAGIYIYFKLKQAGYF